MSKILDELHQDHIRMAQLLDILAAQFAHLKDADADVDLRLMRDIADYFVSFPDAVHHPTEDAVFDTLEARSPDLRMRFEALRQDHVELALIGREFFELMQSACSGHVVPRAQLAAATDNFLRRQRQHMDVEESEIFPLARAYLQGVSIGKFGTNYNGADDPLFGGKIRDGFSRLHEAITENSRSGSYPDGAPPA